MFSSYQRADVGFISPNLFELDSRGRPPRGNTIRSLRWAQPRAYLNLNRCRVVVVVDVVLLVTSHGRRQDYINKQMQADQHDSRVLLSCG